MHKLMKTKHILENNLCILFSILISLSDSDTKIQVKNMTNYPNVESEHDSMKLLGMIKKLVYTRGTNDINKSHNKAMAHMNLKNLNQDRFQDIQDFCNQCITMKKVCSKLGLNFGRCEYHAKTVLKYEGVTEPSQQQINKTLDKPEKNHHAIMFVYKASQQKY